MFQSKSSSENLRKHELGAFNSNEKGLFIIHRYSGMSLYSHEFVRGELDPQLLSGFVGAMTSFLGEALHSEETGWKTMYGSDTTLIVEAGEWTTAVLIVLRDNGLLHNKVRLAVAEFENTFQAFRDTAHFEGGSILNAFDEFVMQVFIDEKISPKTQLMKRLDWNKEVVPSSQSDKSYTLPDSINQLTGMISVEDFAIQQDITFDHARDVVMHAYWNNCVDLVYIPSNDDIIKPTEKSLSTIFAYNNPLNLSRNSMFVIGSLDGRKPLGTILERWNLDGEQIRSELGSLITQGFLQKTTPEHNMILGNEETLNRFLSFCKNLVSEQTLKVALLTTFLNGIGNHPWLSCVKIRDGFQILCQFDETMSPLDYGDLFDALQYVTNEISRKLSAIVDNDKINEALFQARMNAHV